MKILMATQYYAPYKSGLTEYARLLAEGLVRRGHEVRLMAARHPAHLPAEEHLNGVWVERLPVLTNLHRAAFMPGYIPGFLRRARSADVISIYLPIPECWPLLWLSRKKPTVANFVCTTDLGEGFLWRTMERLYGFSVARSLRYATRVAALSEEYFRSLPFAGTVGSIAEIYPPLKELECPSRDIAKRQFGAEGRPCIGFLGRPVAEKGLEHLLTACRVLGTQFPGLLVMVAGNFSAVGPLNTEALLREAKGIQGVEFRFLGYIEEKDLGAFYGACDLVVLPSINATEAFGMVQAEAMLCGTPVVASNLPGVRLPIQKTGMGLLSEPGDPVSIARCISAVLLHRERFLRSREEILRVLGGDQSILRYESLLREAAQAYSLKPGGTAS